MNPKLPLDGHIYTLTAGRVLNTNVFQINLGKLLVGTAVKVQARLMFVNCSQNGQLGLYQNQALQALGHCHQLDLTYGRKTWTYSTNTLPWGACPQTP